MNNVVIPVTVDAAEFWSVVNGSAFDTWEWWQGVEYKDGADWDVPGTVVVTIDNPEDEDGEGITKALTVEDLAAACGKLMAMAKDVNLDDMDACVGDNIFQIAIFGEIIYA